MGAPLRAGFWEQLKATIKRNVVRKMRNKRHTIRVMMMMMILLMMIMMTILMISMMMMILISSLLKRLFNFRRWWVQFTSW